MQVSRSNRGYHAAARVQRLDRRQECRFMLALIMLMGFATASVLATTQQALSNPSPNVVQR